MEGKHAKIEPINKALEKRYKEEKARLEANVADLERQLNDAKVEIERLHFKVKLKDIEIESLVKAMAGGEMNV
jgi:ABC-type Zn uptake system ZnuABC Zn-binding protein ZnuA